MEERSSYYDILGTRPDSSAAAIEKAYRRLAMKLHPDRNLDNPDATAAFQAVKEAYEILGEPTRRWLYDSGEAQLPCNATRDDLALAREVRTLIGVFEQYAEMTEVPADKISAQARSGMTLKLAFSLMQRPDENRDAVKKMVIQAKDWLQERGHPVVDSAAAPEVFFLPKNNSCRLQKKKSLHLAGICKRKG